jgi:nucleotide-binding universal stress UspA family protein
MTISPGTRPTLVCYDGSASAQRGLDVASQLSGSPTIVVVTVWQSLQTRLAESGSVGAAVVDADERIDRAERAAAEKLLADAAAHVEAQAGGPRHEVITRAVEATGTVWQRILDVADEIDAALIVTGTRGHGPLENALLGSVSHAVLAHSGRPVLIAPARA